MIADAATDETLGLVSLRVISPGTGSLGVTVFPEGKGPGRCPGRPAPIARWALEEAGFERVEAEADVANTASCRAIAKAGFVEEGVLPGHCETRGVRHDCRMFALTEAPQLRPPVHEHRGHESEGRGRQDDDRRLPLRDRGREGATTR